MKKIKDKPQALLAKTSIYTYYIDSLSAKEFDMDEAPVCIHVRNAKTMFNQAVRDDLILFNPTVLRALLPSQTRIGNMSAWKNLTNCMTAQEQKRRDFVSSVRPRS